MVTKIAKNQIIGLKEFRLDTEKYINQIEKGASFAVVKQPKPVFRLNQIEEEWETSADFSHLLGGGISGRELLKALKK